MARPLAVVDAVQAELDLLREGEDGKEGDSGSGARGSRGEYPGAAKIHHPPLQLAHSANGRRAHAPEVKLYGCWTKMLLLLYLSR